MDRVTLKERLRTLYPALEGLDDARLDGILDDAVVVRVKAGTVLFDDESPCQAFPMLIEGTIRISKVGANGRELQLYRVVPGESCILTSSCLLGHVAYNARGVAETDIVAVTLPQPVFSRLLGEHEPFRDYVFSLFAERIAELMQLVEAVAFQRLDQRLATLLLGKGKVVRTTHQALADELGSVREIVSRLLKSFAEQGLVSLAREQIEIVDAAGLRRLATPAH
ncbi:MAG: helix-turn-helix domain-containing protein [Betaproteobacteria bacterium]|nr:helix-turn-helix domain-containing protein [Betaproteobacteria bacterium]